MVLHEIDIKGCLFVGQVAAGIRSASSGPTPIEIIRRKIFVNKIDAEFFLNVDNIHVPWLVSLWKIKSGRHTFICRDYFFFFMTGSITHKKGGNKEQMTYFFHVVLYLSFRSQRVLFEIWVLFQDGRSDGHGVRRIVLIESVTFYDRFLLFPVSWKLRHTITAKIKPSVSFKTEFRTTFFPDSFQ